MKIIELEYEFKRFGYTNHTNCLNSVNINLIKKTIVKIFQEEGYTYIKKPPLPKNYKPLIKQILSSSSCVKKILLVIGIAIGNFGWTIIKASRPELFCQKAKNTNNLLLSKLAVKTGCDAFHHTVAERDWEVLLEANAIGETLASGNIESDYLKYMNFDSDIIVTPKYEKNFLILNVPEEFQKAGKVTVSLSQEEKNRKEKKLEILYQQGGKKQREQAWSEWKELNMSWCERMDEDLGKFICKSNSFWHENNLLYKAYAEPEQLEKDGVRLLFFQVGRFDLNPETEEIWSPITSREDYGKDPWQDIPF